MTTTDGNPTQKKPRSQAQIKSDKAYQARTRATKAASQKENFKNIAATLPKAEAERIADILHGYGVKPADVIRATAYALTASSDTTKAADEIRNAARLWRESQSTSTTGDTSTAEDQTGGNGDEDQPDTDTPTE